MLTQQARQGLFRYVVGARNRPTGVTGASVDANGNVLGGVNVASYNIPANDPSGLGLDPTVLGIVAQMPLPNNFAVGDGLNTAGFNFVAPEEEEQMDFVTKIDHIFNNNHGAFVRFSKGYQNTLCDSVNGGQPRFPDGPCIVNTNRSPYNWAGNWRWNPTSNLVNEFVVGQNHFTFDFTIPTANTSVPTYLAPGSTAIGIGVLTMPETFDVGNLRTIDTFQIVNNLSWLKGSHNIKFGTNIRLQKHTDIRGSVSGVNVGPYADFNPDINTVNPTTFGIPGNINTQFDRPSLEWLTNFMLGRVGTLSQGFVQEGNAYAPGGTTFNFDARFPEIDVYAQDSWRPRPNITVDAGLRWEAKLAPSNPDDLIRRPNQSLAVGEPASNTVRWDEGKLYDDDWNNFAPSIGIAWDPRRDGKSAVRGNYRMAFDRINTFLLSSAIFQSIPGITTATSNVAFGQGGGRIRFGLPGLAPTLSPEAFLQPPAVSTNNIRVMDPEFQTPTTHAWTISYQREVFARALLEVAYVGRKADNLFGAYNVNQVEYRSNGFLDAFNTVKAGGESALMNQLVAGDTRRATGESGSAMVRRLFPTQLSLNSVAEVAASLGSRVQGNRTLPEIAGLGSFFLFPYPQFLTGVFVIDSEDYSRYHALEIKLDRRFSNGYSYLVGYTLSRSRDTRSFDPAFTVAATGSGQSASSTPFNVFDRDLNYALSDFDRTHVFQAQGVFELPFGQEKRFGGNVNRLTDVFIGGWTLSGQLVAQSGRPMTVYAGSNTFSNVVQTPANCNECSRSLGGVHEEDGLIWYFTPEERAKFSAPGAGEFSNVGRNYFRGPGGWIASLSLAKRTRTYGTQLLEIRVDATNVFNHPTFGFPTLVTTSATFGRIRNTVSSTARQVVIGARVLLLGRGS